MDSLRDRFAWSFDRHCRCWKWRERHPDANAKDLGHVTCGEASSKGLALGQIRMELQRRAEAEAARAAQERALEADVSPSDQPA